jgi:hypothetical protein
MSGGKIRPFAFMVPKNQSSAHAVMLENMKALGTCFGSKGLRLFKSQI